MLSQGNTYPRISPASWRTPTGKITSFDVEAGTAGFSIATINAAGAVTGWYVDSHATWQGYVRESNGEITKFGVEGAGIGSGKGTPTPRQQLDRGNHRILRRPERRSPWFPAGMTAEV
jgi:hypothetical protein